MNEYKVLYRILKAIEKEMAAVNPNWDNILPEALNLDEDLWATSLEMLIEQGYISGISIDRSADDTEMVVSVPNPHLTMDGMNYLHNNSMMRKIMQVGDRIIRIIK